MHRLRWFSVLILAFCLGGGAYSPASPQDSSSDKSFVNLQNMIRPRPDQATWRNVSWLTDVGAARQKAALENKPILVFMAADGSPLGRT